MPLYSCNVSRFRCTFLFLLIRLKVKGFVYDVLYCLFSTGVIIFLLRRYTQYWFMLIPSALIFQPIPYGGIWEGEA